MANVATNRKPGKSLKGNRRLEKKVKKLFYASFLCVSVGNISCMPDATMTANQPNSAESYIVDSHICFPVDLKDKNGGTVLMWAARSDYIDIVRLLIEKGADVNAVNKGGRIALMRTVFFGNIDIARLLIEKGADVNVADKWGDTALMFAIEREHVDIARLLIEKGADVNAVNKDGRTALMMAVERGDTEIAHLLREKGAKSK